LAFSCWLFANAGVIKTLGGRFLKESQGWLEQQKSAAIKPDLDFMTTLYPSTDTCIG
jgi:hypothetical protein